MSPRRPAGGRLELLRPVVGAGAVAAQASGHESDRRQGDQGLGVLNEPFVVPSMPAGVHRPGQRPLDDPAPGRTTKPKACLGRLTGLIVRLRCRLAQVTSFPA
jgi:hypothetical protein